MLKKIGLLSLLYILMEGLQKGLILILMPYLTRKMSLADFGVLSYGQNIISIFSVIIGLSLSGALARYHSKVSNNPSRMMDFYGSTILFILFWGALVSISVCLLPGSLISSFFPHLDVKSGLVPIFLVSISNAVIACFVVLLKSSQSVKFFIRFYGSLIFTQLLFVFILVHLLELTYTGYFLSLFLSNFLTMLFLIPFLKDKIHLKFKRRYIGLAFSYSLPLVPADLLGYFNTYADRFYINKFIGIEQVGIYQVGVQLSLVISMILLAVNSSYVPVFFKTIDSKSKDLESLFFFAEIFSVLSSFMALAITVVAPLTYLKMLPDQYESANLIIIPLCFSSAFLPIYLVNVNSLSLKSNLIRFKMLGVVYGAVANLILGYFLTQKFGAIGAAWSAMIGFIICGLSIVYYSKHKIGIQFPNLRMISIWAGFFVISLILNMLTSLINALNSVFICLILLFVIIVHYKNKLLVSFKK